MKEDWRDWVQPCPNTHNCEPNCKGYSSHCFGAAAAVEVMIKETGISHRTCARLYDAGISTAILIPYLNLNEIAARGRCLGSKAIAEIKAFQRLGIGHRPPTPLELAAYNPIPCQYFLTRRAS